MHGNVGSKDCRRSHQPQNSANGDRPGWGWCQLLGTNEYTNGGEQEDHLRCDGPQFRSTPVGQKNRANKCSKKQFKETELPSLRDATHNMKPRSLLIINCLETAVHGRH